MNREIRQAYNIKASPGDVWRALTDPKEIQEWTGANAYFIPQPGAMYTLWNGDISGKVLEANPMKKLAQTWMPKDWTRTDSVVTFTLTPTKDGTRVELLHENVEEADYDGTAEGWDIYYLGVIKTMLEKRRPVGSSHAKAEKKSKVGSRKPAKGTKGKKTAKKVKKTGAVKKSKK